LFGKQLSSSFIEKPSGQWQLLFSSQVALHLLSSGLRRQSSSGPGPFFTHFPFSKCSSDLHSDGGGGHDIPIAPGIHGGIVGHDGSFGFLIQSGLHDGSSGVLVQSIGCVMQDASLGFALQSTTGGGWVQDGSLGFVFQSTTGGCCGPHDGSLGLVLQSTAKGLDLHDGSFGVVLLFLPFNDFD
jgi:hypothetical protein